MMTERSETWQQGYKSVCFVARCSFFHCSLVPRLPCSGALTAKLSERGEPGIISSVSSVNGPVALIVCGHTRNSEQEKERQQQATYMYLAIGDEYHTH